MLSPSLAHDVGRVRSMSRDLYDVEASYSASPKRQSPPSRPAPLRESEEDRSALGFEAEDANPIKEGGEFLQQLQSLFKEADVDDSGARAEQHWSSCLSESHTLGQALTPGCVCRWQGIWHRRRWWVC